MIAADGDQVDMRHFTTQARQKTVKQLPTDGRWIGRIEEIAGDEQAIDLPLMDQANQPVEKTGLFMASLIAMQMVA